jgi:hypothetical protein
MAVAAVLVVAVGSAAAVGGGTYTGALTAQTPSHPLSFKVSGNRITKLTVSGAFACYQRSDSGVYTRTYKNLKIGIRRDGSFEYETSGRPGKTPRDPLYFQGRIVHTSKGWNANGKVGVGLSSAHSDGEPDCGLAGSGATLDKHGALDWSAKR